VTTNSIICTNCNSDAYRINPSYAQAEVIYGCTVCGKVSRSDGSQMLSATELAEILVTAQKIFPDIDELPAALSAVIYSRIVEFGNKMWTEGLKQGLLYGEIRSQQSDTTRRPQK
jgi:hypothetical protein